MNLQKDFILLIPYYNDPGGLVAALKSVNYPSDKYEILIVDDGSNEAPDEEVLSKLPQGALVKIITLPHNQGIVKALNAGLKELHKRTDFKYIARLDCGDICHKERFAEQVKFMDEHPDIALLGSWCSFTERASGKSYVYKTKLAHKDIIKEMHFKCSFIHPTVMFKREVLDTVGFYPENYPHAEDYAYFWEIIYTLETAILPKNLVNIELRDTGVSATNYYEQLLIRKKIIKVFGNNNLLKLLGTGLIGIKQILPRKIILKLKLLI